VVGAKGLCLQTTVMETGIRSGRPGPSCAPCTFKDLPARQPQRPDAQTPRIAYTDTLRARPGVFSGPFLGRPVAFENPVSLGAHGLSQKWSMYDTVAWIPALFRVPGEVSAGRRERGPCQLFNLQRDRQKTHNL
jgi:hypothetical protein